MRQLEIIGQGWPIVGGFRIARGAKTHAQTLTVHLLEGAHEGRGECVPYGRYGESLFSVRQQIEGVRDAVQHGLDLDGLQNALPAGAARNALDCALWDLQARQSGVPAWQRAGLDPPQKLATFLTLSLDTPANMAQKAQGLAQAPLLKIKLAGEDADLERLRAIHQARPDAALIADANEGFDRPALERLLQGIEGLNVVLIEQPLPAAEDNALAGLQSPVPLCADESLHTLADLPRIGALYGAINIKLDKTGGLTGALALARAARAQGLKIMLGCMVCTSLGVAPLMMLGGLADFVDLDGPLLLEHDRQGGLAHKGAVLEPPRPSLWGQALA